MQISVFIDSFLLFPLFPFVVLRSPQYRGTLPPQRVPVRRDRRLHPHEQTVQRRSGLHRRLGRGAALPRYGRSRSTLPETFRKPHSQADENDQTNRISGHACREDIFNSGTENREAISDEVKECEERLC